MTDVTNISATAPATPTTATSVTSQPSTVANTAAAATDATAATSSTPTVVSSRLVSDPLARVLITQYLDSSNNVVSQNPVSAVVAYLQNGLTAQGFAQAQDASA